MPDQLYIDGRWQPAATGASPILYAHHVPLGACRRIRHAAAEAEIWPGSWSADHSKIAHLAT